MLVKRNDNINKVIAKNIKKYRLYNKMTQEELATKSGYSCTSIRRLENEKNNNNYSIRLLYDIAISLNVSVKQLLNDDI